MTIKQTQSLLAILDDDKSVQSALRDLIESEGMSTLCFDSAEQFLDCGVKDQASCLIADIGMPGMSGLELQARLKVERCGIPIIFITARGDIPLAVNAMKEGASDFFSKPFEGETFLAAVEHALERDRNYRRRAACTGGYSGALSFPYIARARGYATACQGPVEQAGGGRSLESPSTQFRFTAGTLCAR